MRTAPARHRPMLRENQLLPSRWMAERHRFSTSIGTVDAFVQRILSREGTSVTDDPIPHPPGSQILLNLDDQDRIRLRHYASPTQAPSPILQVDFEPVGNGLRLECEVLRADAAFSAADRAPPEDLGEPEPFEALDLLDPADAIGERVIFLILRGSINLIRRLWIATCWLSSRLFGPWRHRKGMTLYGDRLIALVREVAEEPGLVVEAEPHGPQ